jgi:hypothetical protein
VSERLDVPVSFAPPTVKLAPDGAMRIAIATDSNRGDAQLAARLHRPGVTRDAFLAVGDVLGSDLRRKANDRADYLQYLIARGKGVSKQVWDAQKEYLALQYNAAAKQDEPLDPVLSVSADALRFEVLSRDESTYAQLVLRRPLALVDADHAGDGGRAYGTTFVHLDAAAFAAIARIRSYRATTLAFAPSTEPLPRSRPVPVRWLRAFGQMQAASLLAADRFTLSPVDLYNVLLALRMRKAKAPPRGLRYELVPGERPRLVLEPWDLVVHGNGGVYTGSAPRVIRTWGRNRLNVLARVLPHAKSVSVSVAGQGLPALYSVDLGDATFSLALSGWTDAGWAGISTFDLLAAADDDASTKSIDALVAVLPATLDEATQRLGRPRGEVRRTVLAALAQLRIGHDLATGTLFARRLVTQTLPSLKFRDAREAAAHRLLQEAAAVTLTKVADQPEGRAIEGQVVDAKAHRTFYPQFTFDREGRTSGASCTCSAFRRSGIKEGPCDHMIALRVVLAREEARLEAERQTPEGRARITAETRTLLRRTKIGAESYRLSLDGRNIVARFGAGAEADHRMQRLRFATVDAARAAYFARLDDLATKGYLDATQE